MLLALPCGRDPLDVHAQTRALKTGFITYLQVKQAAGIINIVNSATKQVSYLYDFISISCTVCQPGLEYPLLHKAVTNFLFKPLIVFLISINHYIHHHCHDHQSSSAIMIISHQFYNHCCDLVVIHNHCQYFNSI